MSAVTVRHRIDNETGEPLQGSSRRLGQSTRVCIKPAGKADPFTGANCNFKAIESDDVRCGRVGERIVVASLSASGHSSFNEQLQININQSILVTYSGRILKSALKNLFIQFPKISSRNFF